MAISKILSASLNSGVPAASNMPAGSVIQVAQSVLTTTTSTSSNSFVDTGLSVSITPQSINSKILVMSSMVMSTSGSGYDVAFNFVRNGTNIGVGTASSSSNSSFIAVISSGSHLNTPAMTYLDSPATTSALTYKIQYRVQSGSTGYINASNALNANSDTYASGYISTITVMEISGG